MNWQPVLEDEVIIAKPLSENDFELLYAVASDPEVWDQHPNKDRYRREVFKTFFDGAMQSGGAFIVFNKATTEVIGSSRFYDWDEGAKTILVGYTFFGKKYWGQNYNHRLKTLMLEYAFRFANTVVFHIGATNFRSQRSIEKLGAVKTGEQEVKYFGEQPKLNFVYQIDKEKFENDRKGG